MHDRDGKPVKVGDRVDVPCVIKQTHATEEFCNVTVEPVEPMYPSDRHDSIVLNSKQVVLISGGQ